MNYSELSREEAEKRLKEHDEADWSDERLWNEVIEPGDVLYWLDAFGDQSLAINCQGLPKGLPDKVIVAINEYDVFNDWNGSIEERECPMCNRTLYDFDFDSIYPVIDEYGDPHDQVEYLNDHAGWYWDATEEHDMMCQACYDHNGFHGWGEQPTSNSVRFFYGESGEFSRFSHDSGVIRWDFLWDGDYDKSTDIWNHREEDGNFIHGYEIAAAFAKGKSSRDAMMERVGFKRIHVKEIDQKVTGMRRFWRYAKEVLSGWATLDSEFMTKQPTHPDLKFTYIIEGEYQAWVPEEHFEKFKAELVWQSLREASSEEGTQYRQDNDNLLSTEYYEVA